MNNEIIESDVHACTSVTENITFASATHTKENKNLQTAATTVPNLNEFTQLGLEQNILRALALVGYTQPTPVQIQAIPACLAGRDLLVSSQTGSGKTAAFMLPALQRIALQTPQTRPAYPDKSQRIKGRRPRPKPAKPSVLVLTPTRELALQVTQATITYGKYLRRIECGSILGGMPYPKQLAMLARMPDILVATPGRLLDHIDSHRIDLSDLQMLVFDEADRMLDMGFSDDIDTILDNTPASRQIVMFSATLDARVIQLSKRMLNNPMRIEIAATTVNHEHIEQRLHYTDDLHHKQQLLNYILRDTDLKQAIVFTATKRDAEHLSEHLAEAGFSVGALHGDMHQGARNRTLGELRRGNLRILVATDVAARGIDVPNITHVVNFDLPKVAEDYIHRIGRTGRAGRSGIAINLVGQTDIILLRRIERLLKRRINPNTISGLEPRKVIVNSQVARKPNSKKSNYRSNQNRASSNFNQTKTTSYSDNGSQREYRQQSTHLKDHLPFNRVKNNNHGNQAYTERRSKRFTYDNYSTDSVRNVSSSLTRRSGNSD